MSTHSPELVPADLSIRVGARLIDALVVAAIDLGLGVWIGFGYDWLIVGAAIVLAYFTLFDALAGATLGKLVLGLRIIGPDGGRPSLLSAFTREAFTVLGAIPFAGPLLAVPAWIVIAVTIHSSPQRQGKHDLLAGGTRVIRAPRRA